MVSGFKAERNFLTDIGGNSITEVVSVWIKEADFTTVRRQEDRSTVCGEVVRIHVFLTSGSGSYFFVRLRDLLVKRQNLHIHCLLFVVKYNFRLQINRIGNQFGWHPDLFKRGSRRPEWAKISIKFVLIDTNSNVNQDNGN